MIEKTYNLMAGEVYVYIETNNNKSSTEKEILEFTYQTLNELISIFNFYDKNSILSKLNINKEVEYNFELAYILNTSIKLYDTTKHNFNIFLGNEILARKQNKKEKIKKISLNPQKIITITKDKIILNDLNLTLDLGGIAKGYIAHRTIEITKEKYSKELKTILIDARGDIRIYGKDELKIEIENPFNPQISFEFIKLKNASIVTSGHNKQKFKFGSHIVGNQLDIYTITLVSKKISCYILDALTKYFILLSSKKTLELIEFEEEYKDIEALLILNNGKVLKTSFWDQYK